jgi:uncharacterized RDD family membrane protein YckC
MVAPPVHGALAPDPRTQPARPRSDDPLIPGMRRREKNWQDEVRDRVRKRKKKRGEDPELPLFETEPAAANPAEVVAGADSMPVPEIRHQSSEPPPSHVTERREDREERAPSFEGRILDRVDPLDSLTDLPLRTPEVVAPRAASEASDLVAEFEASPGGSGEQLERGQRPFAELGREFEASPGGSGEQLERGQRPFAELGREFEPSPGGSGEQLERGQRPFAELGREFEASPGGNPEASDDDGWRVDAPLEPRLEPPPRLIDGKPVERPAQALERAQAAALDVVLLAGLSFVVAYFASRLAHVPMDGLRPSWPYLGSYLAFLALVYAVYFTGTTGQTLGKIVFGLRVVDTAGRPPGYLCAAGRAALGSAGVVLAGLGLVPVLFDPARRAFHDRVLHTRVIRG